MENLNLKEAITAEVERLMNEKGIEYVKKDHKRKTVIAWLTREKTVQTFTIFHHGYLQVMENSKLVAKGRNVYIIFTFVKS